VRATKCGGRVHPTKTRLAPACARRSAASACTRRSTERTHRRGTHRANAQHRATRRDRARIRDASCASLRHVDRVCQTRGALRSAECARAFERDPRTERASLRSLRAEPACSRCRLGRLAVNFEFERAPAMSRGRRTTASFALARRARRPCSHRSPTRIDRRVHAPIAVRDIRGRFEGSDPGRHHRSTYPRT
jgi:hypothetical protein